MCPNHKEREEMRTHLVDECARERERKREKEKEREREKGVETDTRCV